MSLETYDEYEDEDMPYSHYCQHCDEGLRMICPDDLCRGAETCLRDGGPTKGCYVLCRYCRGDGYVVDE